MNGLGDQRTSGAARRADQDETAGALPLLDLAGLRGEHSALASGDRGVTRSRPACSIVTPDGSARIASSGATVGRGGSLATRCDDDDLTRAVPHATPMDGRVRAAAALFGRPQTVARMGRIATR